MTVIRYQLFFVIVCFQTFSLPAQRNIDVLHYKFGLALNDQNDTILGTAAIRIKFLTPTSSFAIDLASQNSNGQGMRVDSVLLNSHTALNFISQNDKLTITLPAEVQTNDSVTLTVCYHGIPSGGLIISKNKYGDRTFFADNWPDRAHNWIPCNDEPGDKASSEFIITAPAQYDVISNGRLEEEKSLPGNRKHTHWKEDVPLSTKVMTIGAAKFAVKQFADSPPDIPVSAWVYPEDSMSGFLNYSAAPDILKFFSDYIGPYPFNKLANVQSSTIFGGMENASAIFYNEESAETARPIEDLLAHEVAHQWFGDMVTERSFSHVWLSEGFATYLTDIYIESKYGKDSMNKRLMDERKKVINFTKRSNKPIVDPSTPPMKLLNANTYQKGAWVLHMLRKDLGDSLFRLFIQTYYNRYKGKNASSDDVERVAEEVSRRNLETFFKQWLYTPGIPQLNIQWHYNEKNKTVSVAVTQQQKEAVFQFPLRIQLEVSQSSAITELNITKQTETFAIPVNALVTNVYADPDIQLLFDARLEKN